MSIPGRDLVARGGAAVCMLFALTLTQARAETVAEFYKGKQINVIVGTSAGGGYNLYARLLAHHLSRYVPGNPAIVVQNMPGAGGLRAANYLYGVAPKDGTTFGIFAHDLVLLGALGHNANVQFEPDKFTWLGSSSSFEDDAYLLIARTDAAVKSAEDARRPGGPPLVMGASAEGGGSNDMTSVIRDALGFNLRTVTGYVGSNDMFLAIERGEIEARFTAISVLRSNRSQWLRPEGGVRVLVQLARSSRHPLFPDVPTGRELAQSDFARSVIELAELPYIIDRPFAAPPDIPADRAKALQDAFVAVHKDAQYLEEARNLKLDISPINGDEVLRVIARIGSAPPETVDYMRKLFANKGSE